MPKEADRAFSKVAKTHLFLLQANPFLLRHFPGPSFDNLLVEGKLLLRKLLSKKISG